MLRWTIPYDHMDLFMNFGENRPFLSDPFEIDNLKWFLKCYPNGSPKTNNHHGDTYSVDIELNLAKAPASYFTFIAMFWLNIPLTKTKYCAVAQFGQRSSKRQFEFPEYLLELKEIDQSNTHKKLVIELGIKILQINYLSKLSKSSMMFAAKYKIPIRTSHKWTIKNDRNIDHFRRFQMARTDKIFSSQMFANQSFVINAVPNKRGSYYQKPSIIVELYLLNLPPGISRVTLSATLTCIKHTTGYDVKSNKEILNTRKSGNTDLVSEVWKIRKLAYVNGHNQKTFYNWNNIISFDTLKNFKNNEYISFEINIDILDIFDEEHDVLLGSAWDDYVIFNDNNNICNQIVDRNNANDHDSVDDEKMGIRKVYNYNNNMNANGNLEMSQLKTMVNDFSRQLHSMKNEMYAKQGVNGFNKPPRIYHYNDDDVDDGGDYQDKELHNLMDLVNNVRDDRDEKKEEKDVGVKENENDKLNREFQEWYNDNIRMERYYQMIVDQAMNYVDIFMDVSDQDLKEIGVDLKGDRMRMLKNIRIFRSMKLDDEGISKPIDKTEM